MWKNKFAKYLLEKWILKQNISGNDKVIYLYGLTEGITIIENIVITLFIGFISGNLVQTIMFLLSYIPLRSYAGGYHAKTEQLCFVYSILLIIVVEIFFSYSNQISYTVSLAIVSISIFFVVIYSPLENEHKLLSITEKKIYKNIVILLLALESIVLLFCLYYKQNSIYSGIVVAIIIEAVLIIVGKIVIGNRRRK